MGMEKTLQDVLNAGIALFRAGEDSVANAVKEVQRTFDDLKAKGASDNSESAVKLRKTLDDIVRQAQDLNTKANASAGDTYTKLQGLYGNAVAEIQKIIPQDQIQAIKDKADELTKVIKEKTAGLQGKKPV
jgi:phage host-nuclease inhibitor protein Gam